MADDRSFFPGTVRGCRPAINDGRGSLAGQLRQEVFALTGTKTADATFGGDPGAVHDRSGADLADARHRAHDLGDLRLAGDVIIAGQHIGEREGACFQAG